MTIQSAAPQKWVKRNLQWLVELRARGHEKIEAFRAGQIPEEIGICFRQYGFQSSKLSHERSDVGWCVFPINLQLGNYLRDLDSQTNTVTPTTPAPGATASAMA